VTLRAQPQSSEDVDHMISNQRCSEYIKPMEESRIFIILSHSLIGEALSQSE